MGESPNSRALAARNEKCIINRQPLARDNDDSKQRTWMVSCLYRSLRRATFRSSLLLERIGVSCFEGTQVEEAIIPNGVREFCARHLKGSSKITFLSYFIFHPKYHGGVIIKSISATPSKSYCRGKLPLKNPHTSPTRASGDDTHTRF